MLKDLSPEDVQEDDKAFATLVARVKPLLGELLKVTGGEACRRAVVQDDQPIAGPFLNFTLGSWLPEEPNTAERMYVILHDLET